MKEIGIVDLIGLVMKRLNNPRDFSGRSLVLWNSYADERSIVGNVVKQCCELYNKNNPTDQIWFKKTTFYFCDDNFTTPKAYKRELVWNNNTESFIEDKVEENRAGIILTTDMFMPQDKEDWLNLVNNHRNRRGSVSQDCVMIVCAMGFKEDEFGSNCDIYMIRPTLDEWTGWAASFHNPEVLEVIRAYIKKNGAINGFDFWLDIMDKLESMINMDARQSHEHKSLWQFPKEDVEEEISYAIQSVPDFCDFIYKYKSNH